MPSWKAICQDIVPSYNTGNTEVQNIGGSLAGEKEKREGGKGGKEQPNPRKWLANSKITIKRLRTNLTMVSN